MDKNNSRQTDIAISAIIGIVLWFSKMTWAFELLVILLAILEFRQLERMRKKFLSEISEDIILEIPLKATIYDKSKFVLALIFIVATIIFSLTDSFGYFVFDACVFLGLAYYTSFTISYFHQLIHPRKAYFNDNHLYFYHLKIMDISLNDIEKVELKDNLAIITQSDKKTTIHMEKELGREKALEIKSFFTGKLPTENNGFMIR